MATLQANSFASFKLSEQEEENGQILTLNQKMVLQNKLADIAIQKLNLVLDPANIDDFKMQNSYLQGQLDVMNWQLETSVSVEQDLAARVAPPENNPEQ